MHNNYYSIEPSQCFWNVKLVFASLGLTYLVQGFFLFFFSRLRLGYVQFFKQEDVQIIIWNASTWNCMYFSTTANYFNFHVITDLCPDSCPLLSIFTDRRKTFHISLSLPDMAWFWSTNITCYFPGISFWSAQNRSPLPWCWTICDSLQVTLQRKSKTSCLLTMLLKNNNKLIIIIIK